MPADEVDTRESVTLHVLSAFTDGNEGGNPAAVVLDAEGLTEAQMQAVATEAALSETAFISASSKGGFKLDFFTPKMRIADCGHATVAAFALMHSSGRLGAGETTKEIADGLRRVTVAPDGSIFMEQRKPRYVAAADWSGADLDAVLSAFGLRPAQLDPRLDPVLADAGGAFVMIALESERDLAALRPDQAELTRISEALDLIGFYAFVLDPGPGRAATARMFAPRYGIPEESATGMAAGALGGVLHDFAGRRGPTFLIEQGRHMSPPSPSLLEVHVSLANDRVASITTGGRGVLRSARCISIRS